MALNLVVRQDEESTFVSLDELFQLGDNLQVFFINHLKLKVRWDLKELRLLLHLLNISFERFQQSYFFVKEFGILDGTNGLRF